MLNIKSKKDLRNYLDTIRESGNSKVNIAPEATYFPKVDPDPEIFSARRNDLLLQQETAVPFLNPTAHVSVETSAFLKHLDLSPIESAILARYKMPARCKIAPNALIKVAIYYKLQDFRRITDLIRKINSDSRVRLNLGLKDPLNYKTVWHFLNYRLKNVEELLGGVVAAVRTHLAEYGIVLGKHVAADSTPLLASRFDAEAKYNPYYKMKGYKAHLLVDTDHLIPLSRNTTDITANDGPYFLGLWLDARKVGIKPAEVALDGQYDSFETYAFSHISGAKPYIHIPEDAQLHNAAWLPIGEERIKQNRVELQLWEAEELGKNTRTASLLEYEECPDGWLDRYHRRAVIEGGGFGHFKEWFGLKSIPKGLQRVAHHVDLVMLAILAVVFTRVQHGITQNLTGKAGLI